MFEYRIPYLDIPYLPYTFIYYETATKRRTAGSCMIVIRISAVVADGGAGETWMVLE